MIYFFLSELPGWKIWFNVKPFKNNWNAYFIAICVRELEILKLLKLCLIMNISWQPYKIWRILECLNPRWTFQIFYEINQFKIRTKPVSYRVILIFFFFSKGTLTKLSTYFVDLARGARGVRRRDGSDHFWRVHQNSKSKTNFFKMIDWAYRSSSDCSQLILGTRFSSQQAGAIPTYTLAFCATENFKFKTFYFNATITKHSTKDLFSGWIEQFFNFCQ